MLIYRKLRRQRDGTRVYFSFKGCDKLTVYGEEGSFAEKWFNDIGVRFVVSQLD